MKSGSWMWITSEVPAVSAGRQMRAEMLLSGDSSWECRGLHRDKKKNRSWIKFWWPWTSPVSNDSNKQTIMQQASALRPGDTKDWKGPLILFWMDRNDYLNADFKMTENTSGYLMSFVVVVVVKFSGSPFIRYRGGQLGLLIMFFSLTDNPNEAGTPNIYVFFFWVSIKIIFSNWDGICNIYSDGFI